MKHSKWISMLGILLAFCLMVQPVSAAGKRNHPGKSEKTVDILKENKSHNDKKKAQERKHEKPIPNKSETTEVMTTVEDETTVENGEMLRASTYDLRAADADGEKFTLKYFPVTLYNYDEETINNATKGVERAANNGQNPEEWQGIYFSGGAPSPNENGTVADKSGFVDGAKYYIQNARANDYYVNQTAGKIWLKAENGQIVSTLKENATLWTLIVNEDGTFSLKDEENNVYLSIPGEREALVEEQVNLQIDAYSGDGGHIGGTDQVKNCVVIKGTRYLGQQGGTTNYRGENTASDSGNAMLFYRVDETKQVLVTITSKTAYDGPTFANWNSWDKNSADNLRDNGDDNDNGQKIYTGLVENTLDIDKHIVFTKPDGGLFNDDATVKSIYSGVEMPFVYEDGYYTFDSDAHGVYFKADDTQKSTATGETLPDKTGTLVTPRLYFEQASPQRWYGMESSFADGSHNLWAPFNTDSISGAGAVDYHFGMKATIPFSMTPNGKVVATDDASEPIKFSFSGDDDVWVFIDGQLVIDLGGIHNRLDAEIDFAQNKVFYAENNDLNQETGSFNDPDFALEQTLFENLIPQDRASFAAADHHELTIFYLERGQGSSNAKIRFNLPVNDTVIVSKDATRSWNEQENTIDPLTATEQAAVNEILFGFVLYRSVDGGTTFAPLANTNYYLMNANNQVINTATTTADGHFYLKNGQSAKFITTDMDNSDYKVVYYVHEDARDGFVDPDYNYSGESANGYWYQTNAYEDPETENSFEAINQEYVSASDIPEYEVYDGTGNSGKVTVYGGVESEDSLRFLCSNFLDANLPNPGIRPAEDIIVLDYGLPVEIDVLKNDVYRGESIELCKVSGAGMELADGDGKSTGDLKSEGTTLVYGTAEIADGKIVYRLNKQLTGVEVLNYLVKVKGTSENVAGVTNVAYEYAVGTAYIAPATTMYYEEDFPGLVKYNGNWDDLSVVKQEYQNEFQEPGVMNTVGDSPYGSDTAYLNDSEDSNGTSRHASTVNGAVQFVYRFTGTGTSFFARTTNTTGYLRIVVKDADGNIVQSLYRNTRYQNEDAMTLYNIPVFTTNELDYGTYTVTVTVAKASEKLGYGSDFWLDGIRVVQPLAEKDDNASVALGAYAIDGEQNMKHVTLRNKLLREADYDEAGTPVWTEGGNFVLFTDTDGSVDTAEEYESIGPKEEVYLNNNQRVSFSLNDWDANTNKVYLGLKAPTGTGTVLIGGRTIQVKNAADCYYDITNYATISTDTDGIKTATFTIQAGEGSLISVTNIKVTGLAEFVIVDGKDEVFDDTEGEGIDSEMDGSEMEGSDI